MIFKIKLEKVILLTTCCLFSMIECLPATTSGASTHIVSFLKQRKAKPTVNEFPDFDFESIKDNLTNNNGKSTQQASTKYLVGRLVQGLDTNVNNSIEDATAFSTNNNNITKAVIPNDDAPNQDKNTLENSMDMLEIQDGAGNRVKQSIPVLEPVKHLLNTVRDGAFGGMNHTSSHHTSHSKHPHQLVGSNDNSTNGNEEMEHNDHVSTAIETEEEREMVNESTGFRFLELLGTIAGMIWGFLTSIQKIFAASTGTASSLSSSG